jgi:hypothetical protein
MSIENWLSEVEECKGRNATPIPIVYSQRLDCQSARGLGFISSCSGWSRGSILAKRIVANAALQTGRESVG